jgi:hypothetical protein
MSESFLQKVFLTHDIFNGLANPNSFTYSTSSKVKAERIQTHSCYSLDGSGVDITNGLAACMPGSIFPKVKPGQKSKFLGYSLD